MRGKGKAVKPAEVAVRITPAYAGKSTISRWEHNKIGDHPCVCGEKPEAIRKAKSRTGSPLRMRGKAVMIFHSLSALRITPAYAGKSITDFTLFRSIEDHPCVCGEKRYTCRGKSSHVGSPLRMRGKVYAAVMGACSYRITPAYAGKRSLTLWQGKYSQDHPCVCGEKDLLCRSGR